jgi:hypothetical protein
LLACGSFILLSRTTKKDANFHNEIIDHSLSLGIEIYSLNSSLSMISYHHFSKSFSKGLVSNIITDSILLLDIRVLPNSHGSVVYDYKLNKPFAVILPILNVKYSYTPLIFAYKIVILYLNIE